MREVIIIGGGSTGMNAALVLGRVRRDTLLVDAGEPRNSASGAAHGLLSRDGIPPAELRRIARDDLAEYPSVRLHEGAVLQARAADAGFEVELSDGTSASARRLLLATGVTDELPPIPGVAGLWGHGVYHCPYCHGWEVRDQTVVVLGGDDHATHLAIELAHLGCEVTICPRGELDESEQVWAALREARISVDEDPVTKIDRLDGQGLAVQQASGRKLAYCAAFVTPKQHLSGDMHAQLGCALFEDGALQVHELGQTTVPGVYAAGDLCRTAGMPAPFSQIVITAAEGARAAIVIDQELLLTDAY
ncbi:NAD(P)/FAD-dependent oxidoreductase [Spirillospora sp. CA-142024]|uniref:NAD(P)/FAD-dependent oxidoreductase n=1 Tax=Spirillospora sp. CA-142024 TaxID=3240036 RepID=UPI003D919BB9